MVTEERMKHWETRLIDQKDGKLLTDWHYIVPDCISEIRRLLAERDAMRACIDEISRTYDSTGHYRFTRDALHKLDEALSKLDAVGGERT